MSASRLLCLLGASIVRNNKPLSSPLSQFRFTKLILPTHVVRYRRYCCTSATIQTNTLTPNFIEPIVSSRFHPWPEWVAFVDKLNNKGYFGGKASAPPPPPEGDETSASEDGVGSIYTNMTLLKDACLSFSRDRSDIFRKLSTQDMQIVVEKGCPNLFRKVVNSAKRLRVHLRLDEGEVCGDCNLRGSCDRAYLILKEFESNARTVDIVRVLLLYALDPTVLSSGLKSPGREPIEVAARKLLSELVELSETSVGPEHQIPAPMASARKIQFVKMKREDSIGLERGMPNRVGRDDIEMKKGDWVCSECNFMNFARNTECLRCNTEGPRRDAQVDEMKKGDWNCPKCSFMNFASNTTCKRCPELRPKKQLNPGEWECPSCDFLNFRRNMVCKKCTCERPKDTEKQAKYEEQIWTKPY